MTVYTIDGGRGSRIHALVVGVGAYPHCGSAVSEEASPWSLLHSVDEVLTCAPLSATHVARWLIEADWSKSDVKLGTVDVLLSSKFAVHWPKDLPHPVPEQAVYDNVRAAWRRWVASCDQAEDNIALLYFCGHGWGGDAQRYLLVEDLAEDIVDWKTRLIDFTRTRRSMRACKALTQCFFLDTCSDQPDELGDWACDLSAPDLIADAPQAARRTQERLDTRVHNPVFTPTPRGFPSNVDPGNVTPFADALVRTLDGLGADTAGASWVVRTTELRGRFADVLRWYWPTPPPGTLSPANCPTAVATRFCGGSRRLRRCRSGSTAIQDRPVPMQNGNCNATKRVRRTRTVRGVPTSGIPRPGPPRTNSPCDLMTESTRR